MGEYTKEQMDINESKEFRALVKEIGDQGGKDFMARSNDELKALISSGHLELDEIKAKVEANEAYKEAKEVVKDFQNSKRDKIKPVKLRMGAAAAILRIRGVK